jgi:hypothetical protein
MLRRLAGVLVVAVVVGGLTASSVWGAVEVTPINGRAAFEAALGAPVATVDFESLGVDPHGSASSSGCFGFPMVVENPWTIDGITFSHPFCLLFKGFPIYAPNEDGDFTQDNVYMSPGFDSGVAAPVTLTLPADVCGIGFDVYMGGFSCEVGAGISVTDGAGSTEQWQSNVFSGGLDGINPWSTWFVGFSSPDRITGATFGKELTIFDPGTEYEFSQITGGILDGIYLYGCAAGSDEDGDGIDDAIDTGDSTFSDGTTAGTIGPIPSGYEVTVADLPDPDGVHITVSGTGTEKVTIALTNPVTGLPCGTIKLLPGSDVEVACGSIIVRVADGSPEVEIVLSDDTSLFVAANQTAEVEISGGSFTILDVGGTGSSTLRLVSGATQAQVGESPPGTSISLVDFVGFSQPVDNNGVFNVAKGGSNIPLKWRLLTETGAPVTNLGGASVKVAAANCDSGNAAEDPIEQVTPSASGLQNLGDGYYQLNWKTPKKAGCTLMQLSLAGEGPITHNALFKFK